MANRIFAYGTLMNPQIQLEHIGRIVRGEENVLDGYDKSTINIDGEIYPLVVKSDGSIVQGLVLNVTDEELLRIDEYETKAYVREELLLKGGIFAWVYIKA